MHAEARVRRNAGESRSLWLAFARRVPRAVCGVALVGGGVRCLVTRKTASSVVDLDLATGEEIRRVDALPRMGRVWWAPAGPGLGIRRTAAVGRGPTAVLFLDAAGTLLAQAAVPDATSEIACRVDGWYVGCRNGRLYAFAWDGRLRWVWHTPGADAPGVDRYWRRCPYWVSPTATGVVVASVGDVYAVDARGRTSWQWELPAASTPVWTLTGSALPADERDAAYAALGLSRGATDQAVKRAYRRRARATHPDHHPDDPQAATKFAAVRQAYARLRDGNPPEDSLTVTFDLGGVGPTVTGLGTHGHRVVIGSSDGRLYQLDIDGRLQEASTLGTRPVRAARHPDGQVGAMVCGSTARFLESRDSIAGARLRDDPRWLLMSGDALVMGCRNAIQVVDRTGRVVWSTACGTPVTQVAARGDAVVYMAGSLTVLRRATECISRA